MIGLDTNVLMRYIAQDDPVHSPLATKLLEETCDAETPGFVGLVTLAEIVWVSKRRYGATRQHIAMMLRRLLSADQLAIQNSEMVWNALRLYETSKAEFADCLILGLASATGCNAVMTFDETAAEAGMTLLK